MVDYGGRGIRELVKRYRKELDEILSIKIWTITLEMA